MNPERKRIEKTVNRYLGKPVSWLLYVLLLSSRACLRGGTRASHRLFQLALRRGRAAA